MRTEWLIPIPEGKSGDWTVERFTVSDADAKFGQLRAICNPSALERCVPPGEYTALKRHGQIVMSTTPDELRDFMYLRGVEGDGLIAGLGLGCTVCFVLAHPTIATHLTVIEQSADVIALVAPTLQATFGERLEIVHADIFTWNPSNGKTWDWAWYDIWDDICTDNLVEMTRIKRRFGRRILGRQMCWQEERLRYEAKRNRAYNSLWR